MENNLSIREILEWYVTAVHAFHVEDKVIQYVRSHPNASAQELYRLIPEGSPDGEEDDEEDWAWQKMTTLSWWNGPRRFWRHSKRLYPAFEPYNNWKFIKERKPPCLSLFFYALKGEIYHEDHPHRPHRRVWAQVRGRIRRRWRVAVPQSGRACIRGRRYHTHFYPRAPWGARRLGLRAGRTMK